MERSKVVILAVIVLVSVGVVWRIGYYEPGKQKGGDETIGGAEPNQPVGLVVRRDVNEPPGRGPGAFARGQMPRDINEPRGAGPGRLARMVSPSAPGEPNAAADANMPGGVVAAAESGEPNEPMEFLNLRNVEMRQIIQRIGEWTGKMIIPDEEVMRQRLTIYSPKRVPRSEALDAMYGALRQKGYVPKEDGNKLYLTPIVNAKLGTVPTIPADQPLALIENKEQVVQKFFKLDNYSPAQMAEIIQHLVGDYGYVSADESTRNLLVIDTVGNLIRIEGIIRQFDVPEAEQTVTQVYNVQYGDPSEIVQMLRLLLGESEGYSSSRASSRGGGRSSSRPSPSPTPSSRDGSSSSRRTSSGGNATSVVVGATRGPIILIPEPRRKWVIVRASAEDIVQIEQWIRKLDIEEPVESEYEVIQLKYADPGEVEDSIEDGFRDMPGIEYLPSVLIEPMAQTRQVLVFGRKDLRDIVKKMIEQIDIPPGQFEVRHIKLKYADPDVIKENIEEIYSEGGILGGAVFGGGRFGGFNRRSSTSRASDTVRVISYVSLKQVTVIASSENMVDVEKYIEEWDAPLDVEAVKPRIIELRNCDPVEMADLMNTLFAESGSGGRTSGTRSVFNTIFGGTQERQKIVGALYGQLTFEDVPGTKKIIVVSNIPEAYDVVEELIRELDKEEMAEVPKVVEVKYANPEELSRLLNAMFSEQGTTASIMLNAEGLGEYSMESDTTSSASQQQQEYRLPWSTGRQTTNEMPISNVIGRIRFVPDSRTKSILVLAPPEHMDEIVELIKELDKPSKQVMIKAVIVEVDHRNMTSLGLQLAPTAESGLALGTSDENTISALNALDYLYTRSSFTFQSTADVTAMLDFLVKKTNAKILNQQTLWTEDNEEASFFKGDRVAFLQGTTTSADVGVTQDVEFERVGMTLAVRPSITPEKDVDMIINIIISQLTTDEENGQPVRSEMETRTNMIVEDSQTIMLGGILFQQDSKIKRKVPLLGDLPVVGGLFSHSDVSQVNNEMLVFITPYVIDDPNSMTAETLKAIEEPKQKLEKIQEDLNTTMEQFK